MRKNMFILGSIIVLLLILFTGTVVQAQDAVAEATPTSEATAEATAALTLIPPDHVVILVVDDFVPKSKQDLQAVVNSLNRFGDETGDNPTLCYFNATNLIDGQAMADGMGGGAVDANNNPISHGDLVMAQTVEMINKLSQKPPFSKVVITAVPIHIKSYVITDITTAIQTNIDSIKATFRARHSKVLFVINMSFALVPCRSYKSLSDWLDDFNNKEIATDGISPFDKQTWDEFRMALEKVENGVTQVTKAFVTAPANQCSAPNPDEPSSTAEKPTETPSTLPVDSRDTCQLRKIFFLPDVIAVASAGNFGFDFPSLPAAWQGVISVSAGPECGGFKSEGGSDKRLISQRLTFLSIPLIPTPCLSATNINTIVSAFNLRTVYSSSSGEIEMPGIWDYGIGLQSVQKLKPSDLTNLLDPAGLSLTSSPDFALFENNMQSYNLRSKGLISGTSFAAPRMSFAMAFYLADSIENSFAICRQASKPIDLEYASHSLTSWNGKDLSLLEAANMYCSSLLTANAANTISGLGIP